MAHPYHHALSSVRRHRGNVEDYLAVHRWFDESKAFIADFRHRALRHHAEGIFLCEQVFGVTLTNSEGRRVPVRFIGEQHVLEDLGWIPTAQDWLQNLEPKPWMRRGSARLSAEPEITSGRDPLASHRGVAPDQAECAPRQ